MAAGEARGARGPQAETRAMKAVREIAGVLLAAVLSCVAVAMLGSAVSAQRWAAFCEPRQWNRVTDPCNSTMRCST